MQTLRTGTKTWLFSSVLLFSSGLFAGSAAAANNRSDRAMIRPTASFHAHPIQAGLPVASGGRLSYTMSLRNRRFGLGSYGISCVPYARQISGIMVPGNAWQWWNHAEGVYARGDLPEPGSVLNFRANGRMQLGHVAVVTQVVNAREVKVDQANWPSGGYYGAVSHNVAVVDVSEANNWSAVRVQLGHGSEFGSVYPTYGFIYNRPDTGQVMASVTRPAPQPEINRVPSDLRPAAERPWHTVEEVAEAPVNPPKRIPADLSPAADTSGQ